jgi:phage terminase large subunit
MGKEGNRNHQGTDRGIRGKLKGDPSALAIQGLSLIRCATKAAVSASVSPEIKMAALQAAALLELARRKQPPPAFIEYRQTLPEASADALPGNIPCDCARMTAVSNYRTIAFERQPGEALATFQERVAGAIPRDGAFWLVLPTPIILAVGDSIPVPSAIVKMIAFPVEFVGLFAPGYRYKVYFGGRAGGKSWSVARALLILAMLKKIKVGCFRELQSSIPESVHLILKEQITALGYESFFEITNRDIRCLRTGANFLFKGLRHNATEIKSTEGITHCWVEEAQIVSEDSMQTLRYTIREEHSQIILTFNPSAATDATYQAFIIQTPPRMLRQQVNWNQNPFFNETLNEERAWAEKYIPLAYEHIWMGSVKALDDAVIFAGKFVVDVFEAPTYHPPKFYFGADFGHSTAPSVLVRCFITGTDPMHQHLWVDHEAWKLKVPIVELPNFYDKVPGSRQGRIFADCAEEPTIDYIRSEGGYAGIRACEKGPDSVLNGIKGLLAFEKIHVHERCKHTLEEFRLYSFSRDKQTNDVTTEPEDGHDHCIDSLRYALQEFFVNSRDRLNRIWARL